MRRQLRTKYSVATDRPVVVRRWPVVVRPLQLLNRGVHLQPSPESFHAVLQQTLELEQVCCPSISRSSTWHFVAFSIFPPILLPSCCASRSYRHPECSAQLAFACRSTLERKSRFCAFCRLQYPYHFFQTGRLVINAQSCQPSS